MDEGQKVQYEATIRRQEQSWQMRFQRVLHSDRAAVDIGIGALKTVILINAGGLVAMMPFVSQKLGRGENAHSLISAGEWFVGGLILGAFAFLVAYIYQSIVTAIEQHWLAQLAKGDKDSPTKLATRSLRTTGITMLGFTFLSLLAFAWGALSVIPVVDSLK